jgi:DNA-binding NarL/FixJ family response regulator
MDSTGEQYVAYERVLIVEDDARTQLRLVQLFREFTDSSDAITLAEGVASAKAAVLQRCPQLALIDIGLPDGSGLELIEWLAKHYADALIVAISAWGHEEVVLAALRLGAVGYLLKERDDAELRAALQSVRRGGALIDPFIARRILALVPLGPSEHVASDPATTPPSIKHDASLSERESEILQFVARGFSNREIAKLTALSRFTIEGYTKSIYRKLAVTSRTAAVFEAKSLGLL